MAFRDDVKLQVQQSTNIVDLIGEQLLLKHKGREFVGLCPFHEDKNPSMYVSPAKQIFHCFVCGAGGDAFGWMMKFHKMTFPEALKFLAERAGIKVEETRDPGQAAASNDRQLIAEANGLAVAFFQKLFRHPQQGQAARQYIEKRGISAQLIESFQVGYAPDGWDGMVKAIAANKWNQRAFELAGLVSPRQKESSEFGVRSSEFKGGEPAATGSAIPTPNSELRTRNSSSFYDRLRHRIIFPICDGLGRPIAFGGRKMREEDEPKYLNSPETALFNKSRTLYGLHLAKKAIIDSRTAIIVEGYVDVIACHAMGTANAVATLGTALTAEHVKELKKYCEKVVLTFDADAAGQRAADRALEIFLGEEVDVAIAVVPEGKDPGDLMLLPDGAARWKTAIAAATDALDYQFARVKAEMEASGTMTGRQRIAEDYVRRVATLGLQKAGLIRKAMVTQRLAGLLHMSEEAVAGLLKRSVPVPVRRATIKPPADNAGQGANNSVAPGTASTDVSPFSGDGINLPHRPVTNNRELVNTPQTEKSQYSAFSDVASGHSPARIVSVGLIRAERQFMGCLLREPGLFHTPLLDGRTVDEALTPAEMVTPEGRELYGLMYDKLAEGRELSLSVLLADFAERGLDRLSGLAAAMEAELDAMVMGGSSGNSAGAGAAKGSNDVVAQKLAAAAQCLVAHHRAAEERESPVVTDASSPDEALLRAMELRKNARSPLSIMRARE